MNIQIKENLIMSQKQEIYMKEDLNNIQNTYNFMEFDGEVIYENENYVKWNGKIKQFDEKGEIIEEGEYKNGKFTGIKRKKHIEGELTKYEEYEYKNGKQVLKNNDNEEDKIDSNINDNINNDYK